MEDKINWDREDYWNEYDIYDEYFLSFHLDHAGINEYKWKEFVKEWKLDTRITLDDEHEDVSVYNNDYSIVITGNNCEEVPGYYLILTFNKNVDMSTCIRFFRDFKDVLDHYDDLAVREGIFGEYTSHPKEVVKMMIEKL